MYQGNNQQREEAPKESMEDKMVRMFDELRQDVTNMRQEWKQDLRQEISTIRQEVSNLREENNASLRHMETQVAQNTKALVERPQGTLSSTPMPPKSRRKECAKKRKHDVGTSSGAVQGESDLWRNDTYEPVVHEFIATYAPMPSNHMWTPCMKFTLFGREHKVSLIQLGEYLGFYTAEDVHTEEWRNLPSNFDSVVAAKAYWDRITNGQGGRFTGTKLNTSKIVSPALKIMKLLLNLTFGGRNKNLHKVYRFDLFNLWSLEMNEPIQTACMVQQLFTSQTHPKCPYVWIGPVVTRLCHGLGLQRELTREKSIASMLPFSDAQLNRSYAPKIGVAPRPPQGEPQQEQEPVIQGGSDVPPEYAE
nr:uncharacterized protein LOC109154451 [Ipomoea batatas]